MGMNLFNRRKDRCEEYTVEIKPRQAHPDQRTEDMFNIKKDYANWNKGVDVPTVGKNQFIGIPQTTDPTVHDKLRARYEAMEQRGHLGQKLGGSQNQLQKVETTPKLLSERPPRATSYENLQSSKGSSSS